MPKELVLSDLQVFVSYPHDVNMPLILKTPKVYIRYQNDGAEVSPVLIKHIIKNPRFQNLFIAQSSNFNRITNQEKVMLLKMAIEYSEYVEI